MATILQHNGYSINPTTRRLSEGALIFTARALPLYSC